MAYRLTRADENDVIQIYRTGLQIFGQKQADDYHLELERIFEMLAANPHMARERDEISPPVRMHPHKAHLIVYLADDAGDILIVRVRHAHEDWDSASV